MFLNSLNNTYMIDKNATYQLEIVSVVADILKICRITRCTFGTLKNVPEATSYVN